MKKVVFLICMTILFTLTNSAFAAELSVPALTVSNNSSGQQTYHVSMQIIAVMTLLTFIPAFVLMMTSFTRIIIVLSILRQAIGLPQAPTNQILIGIALFMSFFIMSPVFEKVHGEAILPYLEDQIDIKQAIAKAQAPLSEFMMKQTRKDDINLFTKLSGKEFLDENNIDFFVLVPAFVTSELKTAFQIGFLLFIPFLIIDLVVASVLMAMGMMMLSPLIISLPFKIMLFVLVDGWGLVMGTLAASFGV